MSDVYYELDAMDLLSDGNINDEGDLNQLGVLTFGQISRKAISYIAQQFIRFVRYLYNKITKYTRLNNDMVFETGLSQSITKNIVLNNSVNTYIRLNNSITFYTQLENTVVFETHLEE